MTCHRITTAPQTFDLERSRCHDKDGNETWEKLAYCRSRVAVRQALAEKGA